MLETELIKSNLSNAIPFKSEVNMVKSEWKGSVWIRKQVRVRIESTGELSIQSIAQNRLAQLTSTLLKFLSCGRIKSFGKHVVAYSNANYTVPANITAQLSEPQQKKLLDIQCEKLAQLLLPTHQKLFNLGSELMKYALSQSSSQKVCQKVLDMNGEILNLQYSVTQNFLQDIHPEEINANIQQYEIQAGSMLEEFPKLLEKFINECLEEEAQVSTDDIQKVSQISELKVDEIQDQPVVNEELAPVVNKTVVNKTPIDEVEIPNSTTPMPVIDNPPVLETPDSPPILETIDNPPVLEAIDTPPVLETPVVNPIIPSAPKQKYLHFLDFANNHVIDLRNRNQFFSAEKLEQKIKKATDQLSFQPEDPRSIKTATEALENALDCTEENVALLDQLFSLPESSPLEEKLKELVVKDIRGTLDKFSENFDARMKDAFKLLKDSDECPWHQMLKDFYETTKSRTEELSNCHDIFHSRIPGFQTALQWVNALTHNINPLMPLEMLEKNELATHKALVEEHCAKALYFLENETKVERILNFTTQYQQLISLISKKLKQLEESGQYLQLAMLQNIKNRQGEIIHKASSSLTSASASRHYAYALAIAIEVLQKPLEDTEKSIPTDPFEQLNGLKLLSSPYYKILHQQLVGKTKKSLESYLETLNSYQNTLSIYIPILEEKKNELVEPLKAMDAKIRSNISEAKALSVDYATRLYAWQIFSSQIPLDELPPSKLKEYADKVALIITDRLQEITEDAAIIGFKFD